MIPSEFLLAVRPEEDSRAIVEGAIATSKRCELIYSKPGENIAENVRLISPYEIVEAHVGYRGRNVPAAVVGYDHERRDYRTFRLDRVRGSALVDVPAHQQNERKD